MPRTIPPRLYEHLQGTVTTTCRALLIKLRDGREFGVTTLDRDLHYLGIKFSALNGFDSSIIASDTGLSVDNAEATALVSATIDGITEEMILAGELDDAQWEMWLLNWNDLSMGHTVLGAGDLGEVNLVDGMVYIPELLTYAMRLKNSIGHVWQRRCRAIFGTDADSQTGCGVDAESMWQVGEVTGVDDEDSHRVFAAFDLIGQEFKSGASVLEFTSGKNRSQRLRFIEAYSDISGTIALFEPLPFAIEVGDEFRIRNDCNKSPSDCIAYGNLINYKGEPYIPVGDGLETMTPSSQVFGGISGSEIID